MSQPNRAIEIGSATSATRGATASMLTTPAFSSWTLPASVPTLLPAWPGWMVAQLRAGRGSACPLRCRLGTLRQPARPICWQDGG
jgi:hypothetical protein